MKTNMPSQIVISALTVAAAIAVPDGATAGEPMVLTDAQLDRVTAGFPKVEIHLTASYTDAVPIVDELTPPTAEPVSIMFEPAKQGEILKLNLRTQGTETSLHWPDGVVIVDISDPAAR